MSTARLHVSTDGRRLHVRWVADDARLFGALLADFRCYFGRHGAACWCPGSKCWSLPLSARGRLRTWADATFPPGAQVWDDEPEPAPRSGGGGPPPPGAGRAPATELEAAYKVLHLLPSAPPELVTAAHRILVKKAHPDAGGSHAQAVQVNEAIAVIRAAQAQRRHRSA